VPSYLEVSVMTVVMNFEAFEFTKLRKNKGYLAAFYDDLHEEFNIPWELTMGKHEAIWRVINFLKAKVPTLETVAAKLAGKLMLEHDERGTDTLFGIAEVTAMDGGYVFGENDGTRRIFNQIEEHAGRRVAALETLAEHLRRYYPVLVKRPCKKSP
jgi:hypothetical protein